MRDETGYEVTAASAETVARYDRAIQLQLLFADDVGKAWYETVAAAPDFALGQIGRAYLQCMSSGRGDAIAAQGILDGVEGSLAGLSDRERRHFDAARAFSKGDLHGASERLAWISVDYPMDLLALAVGHQLDFFRGDAITLRDRIARTVMAWDESHPQFGFVLGMLAFGLEECGLYAEALETAGRALDANPRDVWAHHAAVHVHEMRGRIAEGLQFVERRRADWTGGNFFVVHNSWHEGLFRLDLGDIEGVLRLYDTVVFNPEPKLPIELVDASALLWRLYLDGVDVGDRWTTLASLWINLLDEPWYVFNDVHAAMAFVAAGQLADARLLAEKLRSYVTVAAPDVANVAMTSAVGLPVVEAFVAFGEDRYADTVALLHPIRSSVQRFGGSHTQRDAVARTLLEAAIRDGQAALARALLSERLAVKDSAYSRTQLARANSM